MKKILILSLTAILLLLTMQVSAMAKTLPANKYDKDTSYMLCLIQLGAYQNDAAKDTACKYYVDTPKIRILSSDQPIYVIQIPMVRAEYRGDSIKGYRYTEKIKYNAAENKIYTVAPSRKNDTDFNWREITYATPLFDKHDTKVLVLAGKKAFKAALNLDILPDLNVESCIIDWSHDCNKASITENNNKNKTNKYTE